MTEKKKHKSYLFWIAISLLILIGYPLSYGPAQAYCNAQWGIRVYVEGPYAPLERILEGCPYQVRVMMNQYVDYCISMRRMFPMRIPKLEELEAPVPTIPDLDHSAI